MEVFRLQMPQLGETVQEGTVVSWLKAPGERVQVNDPLLEVSTDKVDTEVPSTVDGVVSRLLVSEGETVAVGSVLAEIATGPADDADAADDSADTTAGPAGTARAEAGSALASQDQATGTAPEADLRTSPLVARLVAEHGIDLAELSRFNEGRRITRKTVEAYLRRRETSPAGPGAEQRPAEEPRDAAQAQLVPFSRLRRRTAENVTRSKATSPHVLSVMEVDFEEVERLRRDRKEAFLRDHGVNLTLLPFVAAAVATALGDFPRLNASVREDGLVLHPTVGIGIAVDVGGDGLIVPVVEDAARLSVPRLAVRAAELAERARAGKLTSDEVSGGTFTISSQGPYGTLLTAPIINQPQVAILSIDGVRKRPVVLERQDRDEIVVHHTGCLAMSWDHRAVDGTYAARFLQRVKQEIESRHWSRLLDGAG